MLRPYIQTLQKLVKKVCNYSGNSLLPQSSQKCPIQKIYLIVFKISTGIVIPYQKDTTDWSRSMSSSPTDVWKLGRLNHVAIATPDLSAASKFYKDILRAKVTYYTH